MVWEADAVSAFVVVGSDNAPTVDVAVVVSELDAAVVVVVVVAVSVVSGRS